jgi:hypothetical protein
MIAGLEEEMFNIAEEDVCYELDISLVRCQRQFECQPIFCDPSGDW